MKIYGSLASTNQFVIKEKEYVPEMYIYTEKLVTTTNVPSLSTV